MPWNANGIFRPCLLDGSVHNFGDVWYICLLAALYKKKCCEFYVLINSPHFMESDLAPWL